MKRHRNDPKPNRLIVGCLIAFLLALTGIAVLAMVEDHHGAHEANQAQHATRPEQRPSEFWTIQPTHNGAYQAERHPEEEEKPPPRFWLYPDEWVAAFTALLFVSTFALWIEARFSAKRALLINNPPRLTAHQISLPFAARTPFKGSLILVNEGGGKAKLWEGYSYVLVRCLDRLPQKHPIWNAAQPYPNGLDTADMARGQEYPWTFEQADHLLSEGDVVGIKTGLRHLCVGRRPLL
ncbi:MAG: hypothetical protein WAU68_12660 [Vitreimonas sp.]